MRFYVDEYYIDYDEERHLMRESATFSFSSEGAEDARRALSQIVGNTDNEFQVQDRVRGFDLSVETPYNQETESKNFWIGNKFEENRDGRWIELGIQELIRGSIIELDLGTERVVLSSAREGDEQLLRNTISENDITNFQDASQFDLNTNTINLVDILSGVLSTVGDGTDYYNPKVTLLHAGFGNATRISYENLDLYYDFGSKNRASAFSDLQRKSVFIISHWDEDHYSGLLQSNVDSSDVLYIIGKDIPPRTDAYKQLLEKFGNKVRFVGFNPMRSGAMWRNEIARVGALTFFETGPASNSNKAEILLRLHRTDDEIYLTGDAMWKQILFPFFPNGLINEFVSRDTLGWMVIPHHGGKAGGFAPGGLYQRILNYEHPRLKFALSTEGGQYTNIPNQKTMDYFSNRFTESTRYINIWPTNGRNTARNSPTQLPQSRDLDL